VDTTWEFAFENTSKESRQQQKQVNVKVHIIGTVRNLYEVVFQDAFRGYVGIS
jgi:hypothetical protein